jgi:alkylation response protein AidB-like acyl-CoA dehydrogenase
MFIYDKRNGGVDVRHIEHKLGIHGSPTCELTYKNAKAELCGDRKLGLIKYVMALMNGARLGIAAQSVGLSQEAYNEGLAYARERAQFGQKIIHFPAVYDMLSRMKAKLDAGRSMLYQTARYVDLYKCLEDIQRDRKLTPEERTEVKQYSKLADAFTPIAKGMNSEYASQNAYDAISIHGGSGFIMEYKCQRLYRDARIFSIYEGTTQLQVVAAIRYITNGTYLQVMRDMLQREVSAEMRPLQERVAKLVDLYEQSVKYVNDANNQEMHDFLGRRLYDMTAEIIMALLLIEDASRAEGDLKARFTDSANVYTRMVEENVCAKAYYVMHFNEADLAAFRAE